MVIYYFILLLTVNIRVLWYGIPKTESSNILLSAYGSIQVSEIYVIVYGFNIITYR